MMRLTRRQMAEQYPNQWLGLKEPVYLDNDGVTLLSAEIVFTDKTCDELLEMQIDGKNGIIGWYTTDDGLQLGMAGVGGETTGSLYRVNFMLGSLQCPPPHGTGITILSVNLPSAALTLHCPAYFWTVLLILESPKPCAKVSSFVVLFLPVLAGKIRFVTSSAPGALFSTEMTSISRTRSAFAVISRSCSGSFPHASIALSSAFPKMVLISKGSIKPPSAKEIAAAKSI